MIFDPFLLVTDLWPLGVLLADLMPCTRGGGRPVSGGAVDAEHGKYGRPISLPITFPAIFYIFHTIFNPFRTILDSFPTTFDPFPTNFNPFHTIFYIFRTTFDPFHTNFDPFLSFSTLFVPSSLPIFRPMLPELCCCCPIIPLKFVPRAPSPSSSPSPPPPLLPSLPFPGHRPTVCGRRNMAFGRWLCCVHLPSGPCAVCLEVG